MAMENGCTEYKTGEMRVLDIRNGYGNGWLDIRNGQGNGWTGHKLSLIHI